MNTQRPRLAVLLGDPAGVGPEMAVKLLAREQNRNAANLLLIADPVVLADAQRMTGLELDTLTIASLDDIRYEPGRVTVLEKNWLDGKSPSSEEHTSELQSLMRNSYAVFCLKKKKI